MGLARPFARPIPYEVSLARYARAPIAFVREVLLAEPDDWQLKVLRALARGTRGLRQRRSRYRPGKTALAAWVAVCGFVSTRAPFKLAMTAPSSPQLFDALQSEVIKWLDRLPGAWRELRHVTSDHITLKANSECFITARTSRPEIPGGAGGAAQRQHPAGGGRGVRRAGTSVRGGEWEHESSAGAITLLIGNSTRSSGLLLESVYVGKDRWFCMKVGYQDSPRVTQDFADEIAGRYGQDSNTYRGQEELGEFPAG